jgi:HEAT repeat protein
MFRRGYDTDHVDRMITAKNVPGLQRVIRSRRTCDRLRTRAIQALGKIGDEPAVGLLAMILANKKHPQELRTSAATDRGPQIQEAIPDSWSCD